MAKLQTAETPKTTAAPALQAVPAPMNNRTQDEGLPRAGAKINSQFLLKWSPNSWAWRDDWGWYPHVRRMWLTHGVDGIDDFGNIQVAIAQARERGWRVIRRDDERLDPRYRNYCQGYPISGIRTDKGQPVMHWCDMWQTPSVAGGRTRWAKDDAGYGEFLRHLQAVGIIPPMDPGIKKEKLRAQERVVRKIETDVLQNPGSPTLEGRLRTERVRLAAQKGQSRDAAIATVDEFLATARQMNREEQGSASNDNTLATILQQMQEQQKELAALRAQVSTEAPVKAAKSQRKAKPCKTPGCDKNAWFPSGKAQLCSDCFKATQAVEVQP